MKKLALLVAVHLLLGVTGCGKDDDDDDDDSSSGCLSLVNGKSTNKYKSVVMLLSTESLCTATFIAHNAVITASHCMDSSRTGGKRYVEGASFVEADLASKYANGVSPLRYYNVGPKSADGSQATLGEQDLAIVIFPDDTAPATSPILAEQPEDGSELTLVGFGITRVSNTGESDGCGTYKKRAGTNTLILSSTYDGLYYQGRADTETGTDTDDAVNASGDSGGPVFVDGALAGVVSASGRGTGASSSQAQSYAVDLNLDESKEFIQEAVDDEDGDLELEYQ